MNNSSSVEALEIALGDLMMEEIKRGKSWVWNHIKERVRNYFRSYILSYVYQGQY